MVQSVDVSAETLQAFLDDAWETSGAAAGNPVVTLTGNVSTLGNGTFTFTGTVAHGLSTGALVVISGITLSPLNSGNGTYAITVTGANTFTYTSLVTNSAQAQNGPSAAFGYPPAPVLRARLRTYETSAENLFRGGSIQTVSKNSASQSYRGPGLGAYTPVQIANAWRSLLLLFDQIYASINEELTEHPSTFLQGTVSTIGRGSATFTGNSPVTWQPYQLFTIQLASDSYFNLTGAPVVTVPSSSSFTYAIGPASNAPISEATVVYYNANPCLPPDSSDGSVYQLMRRRLPVILSAGTDMNELRLPNAAVGLREGLLAW